MKGYERHSPILFCWIKYPRGLMLVMRYILPDAVVQFHQISFSLSPRRGYYFRRLLGRCFGQSPNAAKAAAPNADHIDGPRIDAPLVAK